MSGVGGEEAGDGDGVAASDTLVDSLYDTLIAVRPHAAGLGELRRQLSAQAVVLDYAIAPAAPPSLVLEVGSPPAESGPELASGAETWGLRCLRGPEDPPFDPHDRALFEDVCRHVARALRMRERLLQNGAAAYGFSDLAERLGIGALLVRPDGRLLDASARARDLLEQADGIFLSRERVCLAAAPEMAELKRLMRAVADGERTSATIAATRPSGRPDIGLSVTRAPPVAEVGEAALIISIRDVGDGLVRAPDALRALYGFTATEAELVMELVNGLSAEDLEAERGISHNTMRAHLRSIYAKTGVGRLADLVRVVASGGAALAPP